MRDSLNKVAAKFALVEDGSYRLHPLICHMVDVAVVAQALWEDCLAERVRASLCSSFALGEDQTRRWVAFLAGAHDLGKASPVFQGKGSEGGRSTPPWLHGTDLEFPLLTVRDPGHGTVTAASLPAFLQQARFAMRSADAERLAVITGGHHGIFPSAQSRNKARGVALGEPRRGDSNPWDTARSELATTLADLLAVENSPGRLSNAASMLLAGFISVVDWIGSIDDPRFFPFAPDGPDDLAAYAAGRKERAHEALRRLHWDAWPRPSLPARFQDLFPLFSPRPLQVSTQEVAPAVSAPGLAILEAPMGEGKTEAAFYLAECWNASGFRGSYIAMPTQATSNQLYARFEGFLRARYTSRDQLNLQLLHGHAALNAEIEILRTGDVLPGPADIDKDGDDQEATVAAAEWFTNRKRGLLAPFGVGTIDQALLSVLQVKHGFVRLFGLAGKTVIIDEVHAYDTYMTTLMERLLEWLAALGSPIVILSATLPAGRRQALVNAYRRGLGRLNAELPAASYPRITWTGAGGIEAMTVGTSPEIRRTLGLRWLPFGVALAEHLGRELRDGGCAAVVCNTVNRAQETYAVLRDAFAALPEAERPDIDLFHARFLFKDRQDREERCLERFGKPEEAGGTTAARPFRSVLVATQVIEQSLDLDFDIMVTELAPIDLLPSARAVCSVTFGPTAGAPARRSFKSSRRAGGTTPCPDSSEGAHMFMTSISSCARGITCRPGLSSPSPRKSKN